MTRPILALRVARRALGAVVIEGDEFKLLDGRHLSSKRTSMEESIRRYLHAILEQQEPSGVLILAPDERYDDRGILKHVQTILAQGGRPMRIVRLPEILKAFGTKPLGTREELWEVTRQLVPELSNVQGAAKPYAVEAAALALYAESLVTMLAA
jgi:hypothetical protein